MTLRLNLSELETEKRSQNLYPSDYHVWNEFQRLVYKGQREPIELLQLLDTCSISYQKVNRDQP
jgi:hypothetical protein